MNQLRTIVTVLACLFIHASCGPGDASEREAQYSDPAAPVGDPALTVPSAVAPIMDYWMRDTYVMNGPDGYYYMTGTTAVPGRQFPSGRVHCWDYNDGLYMWRSKDLQQWEPMGLVWSFDRDAADWQREGKPLQPGAVSPNKDPLDSFYRAVWAPELHYVKSKKKWLIIACMNGGAGSFVLESTSGKPEGPYRNIKGNEDKAIFPNIDLSLFEEDNGDVYLVGHNHFITKMKDDLSDIAAPFRKLEERPYNPEPYIEGVFITKHNGRYQLLQTVWSVRQDDGSYSYLRDDRKDLDALHSYDVVVAEADNIYGPYGPRYAAILQGGHNNIFRDKEGQWWSTTFFNPRGVMGTKFPVTCRPSLVPVKWDNGKLKPDGERAARFYADFRARASSPH
ncbi:family 43 glycosylhydrolase [Chitinophaga japonensis]|uniref:Glycosyl hydrolase family 43 n=1 Tax=Chitinophaga japonensis TaxID=104662 RepID=A0A562T4E2_CHIJA|nr:family 43 glycosylhydrolase [Chitinophaga japonensis]TWI87880.1 glycosyl hydrolase family 43 [Chitinophaga japonensis]